MFILVTNDDGYDAPGLWVAYDLAHKLAHKLDGKNARIGVVAPSREQSGVSHAMSYLSPISYDKKREDHFTVDGTPTDCVLLALEIFGIKPDLVISGVNRGHNLGPDLLYSGTVGAAIEASAHGIPAISLSQYYGYKGKALDDPFLSARSHGLKAINKIWETFGSNWPKARFCNINFPPIPSEEVNGIKLCPAETLSQSNVIARAQTNPNGRELFWLGHPGPIQAREKNQDVEYVQKGYVTVSFCHLDLCDRDFCQEHSQLFEGEA